MQGSNYDHINQILEQTDRDFVPSFSEERACNEEAINGVAGVKVRLEFPFSAIHCETPEMDNTINIDFYM